MDATSQRPKGRGGILSTLNVTIEALNLAKEAAGIAPVKIILGSASILLAMIRDSMANRNDYVELGLACADVCRSLDRGMKRRQAVNFSRSVFEAIEQLTTAVAEIQRNVEEVGKRGAVSRVFQSKNDKDAITGWRSDLNRILHVFNTELAMNTHVEVLNTKTMTAEIHRTIVDQVAEGRKLSTRKISSGELPPPPPRACFGRAELVKKIVGLAEGLIPIALIGPGGIGKTSVALAVLHDDRIKERFGDNRRFIRCDQFPASCAHFLARLSKAIGAGIENPEDLTLLRPSLSSNEMLIVLDNAESILDPQGANGQAIYRLVEELSEFTNICLTITSRITTIPPVCQTLDIPTLSTGAAHDAFYNLYKHGERSESVNDVLKQLDFHPLSVALLATVAQQNRWDNNRLVREWEEYHTGMLQTEHKTSLATTIELSLASPMFMELGPDARGLLGVIAFYPQGIHENNIRWLFPTISNGTRIFDKFCMLSLTYRSNGYITMLAPLRDHLHPKDPESSTLLCMTKEHYFTRMSVEIGPGSPGFEDARWILSEDVNVEHLLDVFTTANPDSDDIWDACINFMTHLYHHKQRQTVLRKKIEGLLDNHRSKPRCLLWLALLSGVIGNDAEGTLFLNCALKLGRERGDDYLVARILKSLSITNRLLGHYKEGIHQAREALEIYERLGETLKRAQCLNTLARSLREDGQSDAAEEAVVEAIELLPKKGHEDIALESHYVLGYIHHSKGERVKAIYHYEVALGIASPFTWHHYLFWVHFALVETFLDEDGFENAQVHIEQAKTHALDNTYHLGRAVLLQARIWYRQREFEDAASEAIRAQDIFKQLGNLKELESCETLLRNIEEATKSFTPSGEPDSNARGTSPSTSENTPRDPDHTSGRLSHP